MPITLHRITLARRPEGLPVPEDFAVETLPAPALNPGEVLVEVTDFSLDPSMRGSMNDAKIYANSVDLGAVMLAQGVGRVLESRADGVSVGAIVTGPTGWSSHAVLTATQIRALDPGLPPSTALGVLGIPGFTAWMGLREYGRPKPGETLVIAAATGPVGSMVGQLAKAAGLRTVAIAGGPDKCALAVERFGFDAALDHRAYGDAAALSAALAQAAPQGIDIYWENVGGKVLEAVVPLMNHFGRIPVCGTVAWYSDSTASQDALPTLWRTILTRRLSVNGFVRNDHWGSYPAFLTEIAPKVASGEITYLEDVAEGLANAPKAFISMLLGGNTGKQIVRP